MVVGNVESRAIWEDEVLTLENIRTLVDPFCLSEQLWGLAKLQFFQLYFYLKNFSGVFILSDLLLLIEFSNGVVELGLGTPGRPTLPFELIHLHRHLLVDSLQRLGQLLLQYLFLLEEVLLVATAIFQLG